MLKVYNHIWNVLLLLWTRGGCIYSQGVVLHVVPPLESQFMQGRWLEEVDTGDLGWRKLEEVDAGDLGWRKLDLLEIKNYINITERSISYWIISKKTLVFLKANIYIYWPVIQFLKNDSFFFLFYRHKIHNFEPLTIQWCGAPCLNNGWILNRRIQNVC